MPHLRIFDGHPPYLLKSMVKGQPKILEVLPQIAKMIDKHIIIGHGIRLDLNFLSESAKRCQFPSSFDAIA